MLDFCELRHKIRLESKCTIYKSGKYNEENWVIRLGMGHDGSQFKTKR